MIPALDISNKFSIIINPFGENFPEQDTKLHKTFYKICEYIKNGGFYICTAGAFWSHQNTITSETSDWALKSLEDGGQSLKHSFLFFDFGVVTTGGSDEPTDVVCYQKEKDKKYFGELLKEDTKILRYRALTNESSDYIPLVRENDDKSFPVAIVRYGKGYLVHAGGALNSVESTEFRILIQVIKSLVINKFRNF